MSWIDRFNERVGKAFSWCSVGMVFFTFVVVILRYFFGIGFTWLQEISIYLHAMLFMGAGGYTLLRDGHVRVDIFYRPMSARAKAWVDFLGSLLLLLPTVLVIFFQSWPYVADSWRVLEGSLDSGGIPALFLLKTMIFVYCGTLLLQGVSLAVKSWLVIRGPAS